MQPSVENTYKDTYVWSVAMPGLFILLWSTGFIGARLGLPYADPFTFLALRMTAAAVLLLVLALVTRAPWPTSPTGVFHTAVAGLLIHGAFLGGMFWAIGHGLSAGVAAIIVAIQPILTAVLAGIVLGERLRAREWVGLLLGLAGVILVVSSRVGSGGVSLIALSGAFTALIGITFGTLYQKQYCPKTDLRSGGCIQYVVSAFIFSVMALTLENMNVSWTGEFTFALIWLTLVLSLGAIGLLFTLIRRGAASKVASLFYLAPPFTVILDYFLFDERLEVRSIVGLVVVSVGVALVNIKTKPSR